MWKRPLKPNPWPSCEDSGEDEPEGVVPFDSTEAGAARVTLRALTVVSSSGLLCRPNMLGNRPSSPSPLFPLPLLVDSGWGELAVPVEMVAGAVVFEPRAVRLALSTGASSAMDRVVSAWSSCGGEVDFPMTYSVTAVYGGHPGHGRQRRGWKQGEELW